MMFGYHYNNIKSWADALANLPVQARWIAKADEVSSETNQWITSAL
jgi:hypothetical protein